MSPPVTAIRLTSYHHSLYRVFMRSPRRTIAIVGGGFSGTVLAVNLLRRASAEPLRIVLIERGTEIGRGVAYQSGAYPHLLNVPAARMSALTDEPLQFVRFAQQRDATCRPEHFLPRRLYGEYLQQLLRLAVEQAPSHVSLERVTAQADAIYRIDPTGPYLVNLSNQQRILANDVVLANGDPPPTDPACASGIAEHPAYVCNPFRDAALRPETQRLLLIGSGLTMADVAIAAAALNPDIEIHAISRHGLMPAAQASVSQAAVPGDLLSRLNLKDLSARGVLRAFRALLSDMSGREVDWRDTINVARQAVPEVWSALPQRERARFLRHLRTHWDVHRHRMPPKINAELSRLRQQGQLHIHAGRLLPMRASGRRIEVSWRVRGSNILAGRSVDRVVNCAGTDRRLSRTNEPLLKGLLADGLAVPDPLGLGWRTDERGALVDRDGLAADHLFYLGPMLRAKFWEATAVGELRGHAERLAQVLTAHSMNYTSPRP